MTDCIFCKIVKGEIPSKRFYENEHALCFMDIANDVDFHLVVIPKKHVKNILDCDEETLTHLIKAVKTVSNILTEKHGFDGVNLLNASDESAGQTVNHFHIHIIPRKKGDGIDAWPKFKGATRSFEQNFEILTSK